MSRLRAIVIYAASAIFAAALVHRFHRLGGPYFVIPETIQDHVAVEPYPSRDAIVITQRAESIIPRGATVTVLMPSQAPNYDPTLYFTATGTMPRHTILAANAKVPPQYIITVREPLNDPAYALHSDFKEGKIYVRR